MADRPTPRPGVLDIDLYVGGESRAVPHAGLGRTVRLASNEGAFGPSPSARAAYLPVAEDLHRYPDGASADLRAAIARVHGLEADRVVVGHGSDELIANLIRAYAGPGDEVVHSAHGFLMYRISALAAGATPVAVPERNLTADIDAILAAVTPRTRLVFLANPNNPTGSVLPLDDVRRLQAGLPPSVVLVLDGAYAEYVNRNDYDPGIGLVESCPNVVMTRTFSKIHGLAALRLGWGYAPAPVVDALNRIRDPFNVSLAAQRAGLAAIEDTDFVDRCRRHNEVWRDWLADRLASLGLIVHPSAGNFVLADFGGRSDVTAAATTDGLRDRGILVRRVARYGLPRCLRISIGLEEEMGALTDAMAEILG